MPELDTAIIADLLNTIAPFAISMGITFSLAETVYQWFTRIAFGRHNNY